MLGFLWRLLGLDNVYFRYRRVSDISITSLELKERPTTVREVKSVVAQSLGIQTDIIDVIDNTVILEDYRTTNDDVTEVLVHRESRRIRADLRTDQDDMFEGSMADGDRLVMSCGHATTPENLYRYCLTKLNSNDLGFKCMECSTTWEFPEISDKADMSDDESVFFSRKMTSVYINTSDDIHHCPKCLEQVYFRYRRVSDISITTLELKERPTTVGEVKSVVAKSLGIHTDVIDVIDNTVILEDKRTTNDNVTEVLVHRESRRIRAGLRTDQEDMFEGSMADGDRLEMSCGHAATPDNLYRYCLTKLNSSDLGFKCMECSTTWEFPEISIKADMSDDESVFFSRKMTSVYINTSDDIRQCLKCKSDCTRLNTNDQQVRCTICSDSDKLYTFCWYCSLPWTRNHSCSREALQNVLSNCERVSMDYSMIAKVPKVRLCPNCGLLIEHKWGCKTMDCPKCKRTFCFSCLKPGKSHLEVDCGMYDSKCKVAPIQIIGAKK